MIKIVKTAHMFITELQARDQDISSFNNCSMRREQWTRYVSAALDIAIRLINKRFRNNQKKKTCI